MDAKEYLEQYQRAKHKIERLSWDIEELQTLAEGGSIKLDGLPHGTGYKNPMEHFILKKIEKEHELRDKIADTEELLLEIEETIDKVGNPELEDLLHYRYIQDLQWSGDKYYFNKSKSPYIVDKMGYSRRWIDILHNQALEKVQQILENEPELHKCAH